MPAAERWALGAVGETLPRPFHQRLIQYLNSIGATMRGDAASAAVFPNRSDIGGARERIVEEVLKSHLPKSCSTVSGGFIFDHSGNESKQIDLIVHSDRALRFDFHNRDDRGKSFSSIEGCIGAIAVKSFLDTSQLREALLNLSSIPSPSPLTSLELRPGVGIHEYESIPKRYIVALDGMSKESCEEQIDQFYQARPEIHCLARVGMIYVSGKFAVARVDPGQELDGGTRTSEFSYASFWTNVDARALLKMFIELQQASYAADEIYFQFSDLLRAVDSENGA